MQAFPNTPDDLIKEMERLYPELNPSPSDSMADIMFNAGQRSIILYMKQWRANPAQAVAPTRRGQGRPTR